MATTPICHDRAYDCQTTKSSNLWCYLHALCSYKAAYQVPRTLVNTGPLKRAKLMVTEKVGHVFTMFRLTPTKTRKNASWTHISSARANAAKDGMCCLPAKSERSCANRKSQHREPGAPHNLALVGERPMAKSTRQELAC